MARLVNRTAPAHYVIDEKTLRLGKCGLSRNQPYRDIQNIWSD